MGRPPAPKPRLIAALCCALALILSAQALPAASGLQVGLSGAGFKDFLAFMGQFSGASPVYREDQLPRATVSLVCRRPVSEAELSGLFSLALSSVGLAVRQREGALYLAPAEPANPPLGPEGAEILVYLPNAGPDAASLAELLTQLKSPAGLVRASAQPGALLVRDAPANAARARRLALALEAAPPGARAELAPLSRAQAPAAAQKLEAYFRAQPAQQGRPPAIAAVEGENAVAFAADASQAEQIRRLLAQMDEGVGQVPALRAFRLRHARPEHLASLLAELAASDRRLARMRVRVDAEAGAVVVLAEPEVMARVERLVQDLDQPRPRILVEALVADIPAGAGLSLSPESAGSASFVQNPAPGGAGFAQAQAGAQAEFRPAAGAGTVTARDIDGLFAILAADARVRVLARPRAAVQEGAEIRVSADAAASPLTLTLIPRQDAQAGLLLVAVRLEGAAGPLAAQARLAPGGLVLLDAGEVAAVSSPLGGPLGGPAAQGGRDSAPEGWTLFSPRAKAGQALARRIVALSARTVAPGGPGANP